MKPQPATARCRDAYTLIEVLVVVVIMGIASAIVVPSMLSAGSLGVQAAVRLVVADILFAQNEAIAAQDTRRVVFDALTDSYKLTDGAGATLTMAWVNNQANNYVVNFRTDKRFEGIEIRSVDFDGASTLEFDDLGSPVLSAQGTVVVGFRNQQFTVRVQPFTGRVTVD